MTLTRVSGLRSSFSYGLQYGGLSTGGILGSSLGQGDPRNIALAFLNFILAAVGEELGVIGIVAVLLAFNLLCHHGNAYS